MTSKINMENAIVHLRPLVIFDMNGILVDRHFITDRESEHEPEGGTRVGKFVIWKRPGLDEFLEFVFTYYTVAVWSSVSKYNLHELCRFVFGERYENLFFIFDQSDCEIQKDTSEIDTSPSMPKEIRKDKTYIKPVFLKNLSKVWDVWNELYNDSNTIIIDDSNSKMINNPKSCHFNPGTWACNNQNDTGLKEGGILLEFLKIRAKLDKNYSWTI